MSVDKTVSAGDDLVIPAEDWNYMLAAARKMRERSEDVPPSGNLQYPFAVARVRNDSGADQDRFSVLGLSSPVISPTDNLTEFQARLSFSGVTPVGGAHEGKFGIILEPLASGAIGSILLAGACPVQMTGADVGFAEISNSSNTLSANAAGSAKVLWADSGNSTRWAYVRFGAAGGSGINGTKQVCTPTGNASVTYENGRVTAWV